MSLSRMARRISLPALLAVVLAAALLAIAPGRATQREPQPAPRRRVAGTWPSP